MLTNGQGYMVEEVGYKEHISVAKKCHVVGSNIMLFESIFTYVYNQRSTCRNHRAVNAAQSDN